MSGTEKGYGHRGRTRPESELLTSSARKTATCLSSISLFSHFGVAVMILCCSLRSVCWGLLS
eukprot:664835-Rhodomonas_salina.2